MLSQIYIYDMMMYHTLGVLAVLSVLLSACVIHRRLRDWKIKRVSLHTCQECKMVFAVGRFLRTGPVTCPRCGHKQPFSGRRPAPRREPWERPGDERRRKK